MATNGYNNPSWKCIKTQIQHVSLSKKNLFIMKYEFHPLEPTTKVNIQCTKNNDYQFIDFIQIH